MICPSCQAENDPRAEVCFTCRSVLAAVTQGTVVDERYEIVRFLGRGGMGAVYQARDRLLEEPVALKILRADLARAPEMARRFRAEIKLARQVSHPNVCRIHEYGEDGGLQYISMELVDGTDLKAMVASRGRLDPREACGLAAQIADGLAAIHRTGIVHRDLKSSNIMVDATGRARVMDFGIAKQMVEGGVEAAQTGYVMGSPEYMSPEQARGRSLDARSDLYSLGVVLFELLTAEVPFRGESPVATLLRHLSDPPPLEGPVTAALPSAVRDVLRHALAKEPTQRPASAEAMGAELRAALAAAPGGTARLPTMGRPRGNARMLAGAALIVAALVAAGLIWRERAVGPPALPSPSAAPSSSLPPTPEAPAQSVPASPMALASPRAASPRPSPTPLPTPTPLAVVPPVEPTPPPPTTPTPAPTPTPTPILEGRLQVNAQPWADVFVDGEYKGQTPLNSFSLPPGPHAVRLQHPDYQPYPRKVTIEPGGLFKLNVDLTKDGVPLRP